ncbi:hypothetical protein EGJ34_18535 [Stenotrophomonas sp. 278]|nr:hypothetical protein EGJ34_18535 [Stenotrophomonas sp. 278]
MIHGTARHCIVAQQGLPVVKPVCPPVKAVVAALEPSIGGQCSIRVTAVGLHRVINLPPNRHLTAASRVQASPELT